MNAASTSEQLVVAYGGYSSEGPKDENQDAFAASQPQGFKGAVAVIADGVSTATQAQMASQTLVTQFIEEYFATPESWAIKTSVVRVLNALNRWLCHHDGMVTTFSALIIRGNRVHIFHTGDCRIYRLRDDEFEQLTHDHRSGSYLTRALGMDVRVEVDYIAEAALVADRFLLSSDGVHDVLNGSELRALSRGPSLETCAREMVEKSLSKGSQDNCTCLLVDLVALPEENIDEAHLRLTQQVIPPRMDTGVTIDDYKVIRPLHIGTRSLVYLVEDPECNRYVMKTPSVNFEDDPRYLESFVREEWVGKRIQNPRVMRIHERPVKSKFLYHIAEFVEGQTLRQWISDHPRPSIEEVRWIANDLVRALRAMHRQQMLHLDVKPENVMIDLSGNVKLIDFGAVYVTGFDEVVTDNSLPEGAVGYAAPEILLNQPATESSDLYSLGVVVYEMLTGKLPFSTPLATSQSAWLNRDYISLANSGRDDIPEWLNLALQKSMAHLPENRYEALCEFDSDLSRPNPTLMRRIASAPFIERNPLLFWKLVSGTLLLLLMLSLVSFA